MDYGVDTISMIKSSKKRFLKDTTAKMTKDWPVGSYLFWKKHSVVPRNMPLIATGYKYTARKLLSFIATKDAGSKKSDINYLYKYLDPFANVAIHSFACPFVMPKLFGSDNEVDSHKKMRWSDLVLEK